MLMVDAPVTPSIAFFGAGAGDVDVALRPLDLQAVLVAENWIDFPLESKGKKNPPRTSFD